LRADGADAADRDPIESGHDLISLSSMSFSTKPPSRSAHGGLPVGAALIAQDCGETAIGTRTGCSVPACDWFCQNYSI